MQEKKPTTARRLAQYACGTCWEDLPEKVQLESVRAMLNWTACAVGGARTPSTEAALRGVLAMNIGGKTPILGRSERTSMADAALVTCLSSSAQTFDDTHLETITHPTGPVAAAALSVAHQLSATGDPVMGTDFLTALALGIETECRVSKAIAAGGSHIGWFMTGLSGGIGAAIAVARLLNLSEEQTTWAIGLATAQAGGLRATHGSMAIAFVPGVAARNGLASAYLAKADFNSSDILIDGRNGLLEVVSNADRASLIVQELGTHFEMMRNAYKPYPCGIVIHPAIDACLELAKNPAVVPDEIEDIALKLHPDAMRLCWRKLPENEMDAQVSVYHWVAAALLHKEAGLDQGTLACVMDTRVRALQEKIQIETRADMADNQAIATIVLKDGRRFDAAIENATGSITNPMTNQQLAAKFRGLCAPILGATATEQLLEFCLGIPGAQDIAEIFDTGVTRHA